ncbi:putative transcription factor interactor and regulator CCHC(Zn) family [Helianthus annuus]|nr:putative transcription factor interactor and regulator CCHC(Zn) family [Helianthus annuus]
MSKRSKEKESADRAKKHPVSRLLPDLDSKDRISTLEREMARMKKKEVNAVQFEVCEDCGDIGHRAEQCPTGPSEYTEEVNQVYGDRKQYDMNSNTYHPGLRNHPNFRYGNASNQMNPNFQSGNQGGQGGSSYETRQDGNQGGYQRNYNQGYQGGYQRNYNNQGGNGSGSNNQTGGNDLSAKMDALLNMQKESQSNIKESHNDIKEIKKTNEIRDKAHEALAKQVGQLAEEMAQIRGSMGKLPSDTTVNPKHQGLSSRNTREVHLNEISLRSGRVIDNGVKPPSPQFVEGVVEDASEDEHENGQTGQNKNDSKKKNNPPVVTIPVPKAKEKGVETNTAPYPEALKGPIKKIVNKRGPQQEELLEIFKQVKINLPLLDAIKQLPSYAKYLKDLCSQKQTHKFPKKLDLAENVSSILSGALPPKLQDPGAPIISIQVGNFKINQALLDIGASVSILPGSLYDQYEFGPLQSSNTTVVLADLTPKLPRGVVSDVIVKIEDFYYPVDFLVLDYMAKDPTKQPTVIWGRPFLATANAQIDCRTGTVDMTFGNRRLRLHVFSGLMNPPVDDECYMADIVDTCIL